MVLFMPLRGARIASGAYSLVALEKWVQAILRLVSITVLFLLGLLTIETAVVAQLASIVLGSCVLAWPITGASRRDSTPDSSAREEIPRAGAYGLATWCLTVGGLVLLRADQLWLGWLGAEHALGLYVVASTIGELSLLAATAMRMSLLPRLLREGLFTRVSVTSRQLGMAFVGLLGVGAVASLLPTIIPLFFGDDFAEASIPAVILLFAFLIASGAEVLAAVHGAVGTLLPAALITWLVAVGATTALWGLHVDSPLATAWVKLVAYAVLLAGSISIVVLRNSMGPRCQAA
jgi:O-antigen/teichoic acid export membrane protein